MDKYIENIGGNKFKIGSYTFDVEISIPPYDISINELQNSINVNRDKLKPNLNELERLIDNKVSISDGRVQAIIKDLITRSTIINSLVSVMQLKGQNYKLLPLEAEIVEVINYILMGMKDVWVNRLREELIDKERNLAKCKKDLRSSMGFKLFRRKAKKDEDIFIANVNLATAQKEFNNLLNYINSVQ